MQPVSSRCLLALAPLLWGLWCPAFAWLLCGIESIFGLPSMGSERKSYTQREIWGFGFMYCSKSQSWTIKGKNCSFCPQSLSQASRCTWWEIICKVGLMTLPSSGVRLKWAQRMWTVLKTTVLCHARTCWHASGFLLGMAVLRQPIVLAAIWQEQAPPAAFNTGLSFVGVQVWNGNPSLTVFADLNL